jgi:hypothetical protein
LEWIWTPQYDPTPRPSPAQSSNLNLYFSFTFVSFSSPNESQYTQNHDSTFLFCRFAYRNGGSWSLKTSARA